MTHKAFRPARALSLALATLGALSTWMLATAADPGKVSTTIGEQVKTEQAAAGSQARINQLDDEAQKLLGQYRQVIAETASLKAYNQQMAIQIKSQVEEMNSIQKQLVEIEHTAREILPLMVRMLETLEKFVDLDAPFLPDERKTRVATLKDMMTRADVSLSEKYRRIVEAYQIEMEYGRTIEAYEGKIDDRTVDFLRIGRVALMYQTLDGKETGYWDADQKKWVEDDDYGDAVARGLKIARGQTAPDLLIAPLPAAKEIKS